MYKELLFAGNATSLSESDLGHLFEIAAHLVNNSGLTIDDQLTQLESLVTPIISAMQELIHSPSLQVRCGARQTASLPFPSLPFPLTRPPPRPPLPRLSLSRAHQNGDADRVGDQLAQKISFLAQLSKGTNKSVAQLWPVYTSMVQASTSALVTLPTHTALRAKVRRSIARASTQVLGTFGARS